MRGMVWAGRVMTREKLNSVSVSSRGATLVLVTPTRRQIWSRNIICPFTLDIAKCVSINTAKLEPYCSQLKQLQL